MRKTPNSSDRSSGLLATAFITTPIVLLLGSWMDSFSSNGLSTLAVISLFAGAFGVVRYLPAPVLLRVVLAIAFVGTALLLIAGLMFASACKQLDAEGRDCIAMGIEPNNSFKPKPLRGSA